MREHRHAAWRGSQSAYKAGQRRLPTQRGTKVRTPFRQTSNPLLEAVFTNERKPMT